MHRLKLFDKYMQLKRISKGDALLFAMPKKNINFLKLLINILETVLIYSNDLLHKS